MGKAAAPTLAVRSNVPATAPPSNTQFTITPYTLATDALLKSVRATFGLDAPPFDDIDDDLLLLAFIPECSTRGIDPIVYSRIKSKYKTCSHQTLEFYGDRILYGVVSSVVMDTVGLDSTPGFLTTMVSTLTNNRTMTDIMLNKTACPFLRTPKFIIRNEAKFHNQCADAFEAVIGMLFVHAQQKRLAIVESIKEWLLRSTNMPFYVSEYIEGKGLNNSKVYAAVDKRQLIDRLNARYREQLGSLEQNKAELGDEMYGFLVELFEREYTASLDDFAPRAVVVDPNDSVEQLYSRLGWSYQEPVYNDELELWSLLGRPNGAEKRIALGETREEVLLNARQYLVDMGYIVPVMTVQRHFAQR